MKKYIWLIAGLLILGCSKYENERTIHGVIVDVGSCGGGEGFFSGNYECKVAVMVNGKKEYWNVYGRAIKGQTVSRKCRDKDGVTWCGVGR